MLEILAITTSYDPEVDAVTLYLEPRVRRARSVILDDARIVDYAQDGRPA